MRQCKEISINKNKHSLRYKINQISNFNKSQSKAANEKIHLTNTPNHYG